MEDLLKKVIKGFNVYCKKILIVLFILPLTFTPALAQETESLFEEAVEDYINEDRKGAKIKFQNILGQDPCHMMAHYYLGLLLMESNDINQAIVNFEYVFKNASESIEGIGIDLAQAYDAAEKFDKSLPIYKKIYEQNPSDDATSFQYAVALQNTGNMEQAKVIYDRFIESHGVYAEAARYQLALYSYNLGAYVTAYDAFKRVDPKSDYADAAKQYTDILLPMTKLFSVYLSGEYSYNDNVSGSSSIAQKINAVPTQSESGYGWDMVGTINSRKFEISEQLGLKLGYLYVATLYLDKALKSNDFIGHFINPSLIYVASPSLNYELKGEWQYFNSNHQLLSQNYGASLITNITFETVPHSIEITTAYLKKNHTKNYTQDNTAVSLQYLNSNTYSFGVSGTLNADSGASFTSSYEFSDERTLEATNQARDARSQTQTISASANLLAPEGILGKYFPSLSVTPSITYTRLDYINPQSIDTSYSAANTPNVAALLIGKKVYSNTTQLRVQLDAVLYPSMGLTLSVGYEHSKAASNARSLNTKYNKYFTSLAASF